MRSDIMKKGKERAAHRSLLAALGLTKKEIERPLIAHGCLTFKYSRHCRFRRTYAGRSERNGP